MKIAIPLVQGKLAAHFGHCQEFALVEVDEQERSVIGSEVLEAPLHEPGLLPRWLHEHGADIIVAGGMGRRAQGLFAQSGVQVIVGAPTAEPQVIVRDYLEGTLQCTDNICDH